MTKDDNAKSSVQILGQDGEVLTLENIGEYLERTTKQLSTPRKSTPKLHRRKGQHRNRRNSRSIPGSIRARQAPGLHQ